MSRAAININCIKPLDTLTKTKGSKETAVIKNTGKGVEIIKITEFLSFAASGISYILSIGSIKTSIAAANSANINATMSNIHSPAPAVFCQRF